MTLEFVRELLKTKARNVLVFFVFALIFVYVLTQGSAIVVIPVGYILALVMLASWAPLAGFWLALSYAKSLVQLASVSE